MNPAKDMVHEKNAKDNIRIMRLEFSRSTYSVKVLDGERLFWPLLEFDEGGRLKDALCECETLPCDHIQVAINASTRGYLRLHQLHDRHIWHKLFYHFCQSWSWDEHSFELTEDGLIIGCDGQKMRLEAAHPKIALILHQTVQERPVENERNSIKFSNLPSNEIRAWSQGSPGKWLSYELSIWSDLAKVLFIHDVDRQPQYYVQLEHKDDQFFLLIDAETYEIELTLDKDALTIALETLHTLDPSIVHSARWQDNLVGIRPQNDNFELIYKEGAQETAHQIYKLATQSGHNLLIPGWGYWPQKGLWRLNMGTENWPQELSKKQLAYLLDDLDHTQMLLSGFCVNFEPLSFKYCVYFSDEGSLCVEPYLWQPEEVQQSHIMIFQHWAFDPSRGFQRLQGNEHLQSIKVKPNEVEKFLQENLELIQRWANFEVHTAGLAQTIEYELEPTRCLRFFDPLAQSANIRAYGNWLYTPSKGLFWQKSQYRKLCHGLTVPWRDISKFLTDNRSELDNVAGFWASESALQSQHLRAQWDGKKLQLEPYNVLKQSYQSKTVYLFDDYSFVEGEGFCSLNPASLLPYGYEKPFTIEAKELEDFLQQQWPSLCRFIEKIPSELVPVEEFTLGIHKARAHSLQEGVLGIQASIETALGSVDLAYVIRQPEKLPYVLTPAGFIDRASPRWRWFQTCRIEQIDEAVWVQLAPLDLLKLRSYCTIDCKDEHVSDLLSGLIQPHSQMPDISLLKSQLRPYQLLGVRWLWQLISYGLGALLCDDMGLGKTHQVMAILAAMITQKRECKILIACPTSVLFHWQDKLKEFLPAANVQLFYGPSRRLEARDCQVVLTSFGVLRLATELDKVRWDLAVFDEVQLAKNARSQIWRACGKLNSAHKIGLSGTPVENTLKDLKAIFDVIFPGYLPADAIFKSEFVIPIEKYKDSQALAQFKNLVQPLVLRRTKREVLTDLPGKIEEVGYCQLSEEQSQLYRSVLNSTGAQLVQTLKDESQSIPYVHIFSVLNSLKQICNHPACYWRNREVSAKLSGHQSGKWDLFKTLLEEALASGQKLVVFSQYLAMLDLIEEYLNAHKVHYSGLRGATRRRSEAVARFQNDDNCKVFVASLTAGGLGIDLTAGSVVILYDRWWNAARENQAVDRVHRIGQSRGVQVFRLVTRNSLEERIDEIIGRKAKLLEDIAPSDDPHTLKRFTRQELIELLQYDPFSQPTL